MKKIILTAIITTLATGFVSGQDTLESIRRDVNANTQDIMMVNNDSVIRDFRLQDQINDLKSQQGGLENLQAQHKADIDRMNNHLASMESDLNNFKGETRKGIAGAIAIAGLERPNYSDDHKLGVMVGTGTYKGHTAIAYGITYQPNWNTVIAVKGTDDAVSTSIGFTL